MVRPETTPETAEAESRIASLTARLGELIVAKSLDRADFQRRALEAYQNVMPRAERLGLRFACLGDHIDQPVADSLIADLVEMSRRDPEADINLFIDSNGGEATAMEEIQTTMAEIPPAVRTICLGEAHSAAGLILAGGAAGRRFIIPGASVMIHSARRTLRFEALVKLRDLQLERRPAMIADQRRQFADFLRRAADEIGPEAINDEVYRRLLLANTRLPPARLEAILASGEDFLMTPKQALDLGFVDHIIVDLNDIDRVLATGPDPA